MTAETIAAKKGIRRFNRADASAYLRDDWGVHRSPRTLAKEACQGGGPPMEYAGRFPLYPQDGLDEWAAAKIGPRVRSTSERDSLNTTPPSTPEA